MRVGDALVAALDRQALEGAAWAAVLFGTGIGIWFALPFEPCLWLYLLLGAVLAGAALWRGVLGFIIALLICGFMAAGARAHWVAAPVLEQAYYGPVTGTLAKIDRSGEGRLRLTLRDVQLLGVQNPPSKVRLSLSRDQEGFDLRIGARLMTTARLTPPSPPSEPGGFDFRRFAYFEGLGAIGATGVPIMTLQHAQGEGQLGRLRQMLSARIRAVVAGDAGGFLAAVLTGDRTELSPQADEAMRASNLYHLVSISGTHMALLGGFVFALLRGAIALVPPLALRLNARKGAAALALPVAFFYLLLAGRDVATERAFVMVAVSFGAILLDRRALSVQSVAIAALIVLALRPEALLNVGFQMSFAAALGLALLMKHWLHAARKLPVALALLLGALAASAIAGLATAPFAAANFGRLPNYGLLANLLAGPLMGFVVMPLGILAPLFALFGLEALPLTVAGWGAEALLGVAHRIAAWPGAVVGVAAPSQSVLPLLVAGMLFLILWRGGARWAGLALAILAFALWAGAERPMGLVSADGAAVGVMGPQGRVFSKPRGAAFAVQSWLERDGDLATQAQAAARTGFEGAEFAPLALRHVFGAKAIAALSDCADARILIVAGPAPEGLEGCEIWDRPRLQAAGGIAISSSGQVRPVLKAQHRLWQ